MLSTPAKSSERPAWKVLWGSQIQNTAPCQEGRRKNAMTSWALVINEVSKHLIKGQVHLSVFGESQTQARFPENSWWVLGSSCACLYFKSRFFISESLCCLQLRHFPYLGMCQLWARWTAQHSFSSPGKVKIEEGEVCLGEMTEMSLESLLYSRTAGLCTSCTTVGHF